jgi:hypothetical protein
MRRLAHKGCQILAADRQALEFFRGIIYLWVRRLSPFTLNDFSQTIARCRSG